jgi:hypothetical protein
MRNHCTATPDFIAQRINECCLVHDVAYVAQVDKTQADLDFYNCVANSIGIIPAVVIGFIASVGGVYFWYRRKIKNMIR